MFVSTQIFPEIVSNLEEDIKEHKDKLLRCDPLNNKINFPFFSSILALGNPLAYLFSRS
jgi:hypothetical protein